MNVERMVKRRKDSGFTLIELMIVIAVIGILAVVLVPKVGSIKTQAKTAGIDVNMRAAQAEVQGHISYWSTMTGYNQATINTEINGNTSDSKNPLNTTEGGIVASAVPTTPANGTVYVVVPASQATLISGGIDIKGYDDKGTQYKETININP